MNSRRVRAPVATLLASLIPMGWAGCGAFDGDTPALWEVPCGPASEMGACRTGRMLCDSTKRSCGVCLGAVHPEAERCDGKDNDCNGSIDDGLRCQATALVSEDAGAPDAATLDAPAGDAPDATTIGDAPERRACRPRAIRMVTEPHFSQQNTPPAACQIDEAGLLTMRYPTVTGCPVYADGQRPYRACYFGQNEDVSEFQAGHGVFEARYCFEGPLHEDLNIWFDTQTEPSAALTFVRLHRTDDHTQRSCRVVLFSARESCVSQGKCNALCVDPATLDAGAAPLDSAEDVAVADDGGAMAGPAPDGGTGPTPALSCNRFERVKVRVTTEWCQCADRNCDRPAMAEVRLRSLVYYPDDCLCSSDSDCEPGTLCRKDALSPDAACWKDGSCRGICAP